MSEVGELTIPAAARLRAGDLIRVLGPRSWELAGREGALRDAVRVIAGDDCWVLRSPSTGLTCLDLIDGHSPNGTVWTEAMCCLPCRLRAALDQGHTGGDEGGGS